MLGIEELSGEIRRASILNSVLRAVILSTSAIAVIGFTYMWVFHEPGP
jgi:hypothetical protein